MKKNCLSVCAAFALCLTAADAAIQAPVPLGSASSYAVLAGSTVTNTGSSVVTGNLGLSPGTVVTGFPPGTVIGTINTANTAAATAKTDLTTAYNDAAGRTPVLTVPTELGGTTLTSGVYTSAAGTFSITGTLTLNAEGNANAVFIFKMASTLTTAAASKVSLINGATACNIFWQVGSSATLGAGSHLEGTILANASITLTTGATLSGRALAGTGAVTLDTNTITTPACAVDIADLTIVKTHSGSFTQGQAGATYTLTATNAGLAPTVGVVAVSDTLPAGLTATAISGTGWTCVLGTLNCTRSDVLAPGASYEAITVTVNVASNAAPSVINTAAVSGGGQVNFVNDTASDTTAIVAVVGLVADLTISKTHLGSHIAGSFRQGETGDMYILTARNVGLAPTFGVVTVSDTLPAGLTATAISGTGWSCTLIPLACTRSDVLAAGASYPAITVTVDVAGNAPTSVINTAVVAGGGEVNALNDTASDTTPIIQVPAPVANLTVSKSHSPAAFRQGDTGDTYTLTVHNAGLAPTTTAVTVGDTLPAGLTATAISGADWSCTLTPLSCTRSDALAAGASFPSITVTVNVASNAAAFVINTATVSGGGSVSDTTPVIQLPAQVADVTVTKSHTGNFRQGDTGDTYTLTVRNVGLAPTVGAVAVSDALPAGLTATAISGTGWTCVLASLSCTRNDALAPGASYPAITVTVDVAGNPLAFNQVAGSPVFQTGDLLISMADGTVQWRRGDWTLVKVLTGAGQAKGLAFDSAGNLYVTHWSGAGSSGNNVMRFDRSGNVTGLFGSGYDCNPTSILFDNSGNAYVGQADCGAQIFKFDSAGNRLAQYSVALENRGSTHIVLDPNQCTMYYTSEGFNVKRFNVCTNSQMPDFNTAPLPDSVNGAQDFALLPGGGMLVDDFGAIVRLDAAGALVATYNAPAVNHCWLGIALASDGTSFWASNWCESSVTRFDIATGNVIESHVVDDRSFMVKQLAVPKNIFSTTVTNTATVAGGGEVNTSNDFASDTTTINPPAPPPPVNNPAGIVNAASYVPTVAAGSIASAFGSNLAIGQASASTIPLPTTLAGSTFQIGGFAVPLFFASPTQVNLQIPWELAGQTQARVSATVGGVASTSQIVNIAPFAPGILSSNATGTGQGAVLIASTALLAAPGTPVPRGGYVSIFCTGLGAVTNQPASGAAAQADPLLSLTLITPTVTIGGIVAGSNFSGLAPGFVGLYQVNAQVPAGVSPGDAVPVFISIGSVTSNTVTIAVQ